MDSYHAQRDVELILLIPWHQESGVLSLQTHLIVDH